MSYQRKLRGLYVITDDTLTPDEILYIQVEDAIKGGATIVQLRDKKSSDEQIEKKAIRLQQLCRKNNVLFVLNDKIDLAIKLQCDGLHIGKSDHENFVKIRDNFDGIIGVSCYGDINKARHFELLGANYVAFGSFYSSPTKPDSNIVPLETIALAKEKINIPVCVIGGINTTNLDVIMSYKPDMVSVISDIWNSSNIKRQAKIYATTIKEKKI
jgi:thiamine-phosphate pyrophosphorylase